MKKGNSLISTLYGLCNVCFYLLILLFAFTVTFQILGKNVKLGNGTLGNYNSFMYQVPVNFQISPEKPMFNNLLSKKTGEDIDINGREYSSGTLEYVKPLTSKDSTTFKTIVSIHNNDMTDYYEFVSPRFIGDGYVNIKSKTLLNKIIMFIRAYINFILLIVIFFFLKTIFKELRSNFQFSDKLSKLIKTIGALLVFKVLFVTVSGFILGLALPYISIEPINLQLKYANISMNPRLEFDFVLFLIGLSLIILNVLLKEGNRIQQENELTI